MRKQKRKVLTFSANDKVIKALEYWGFLDKRTGRLNKGKNLSELINRLILSKLRNDANNDFKLARAYAVWQINELKEDRDKYCEDIDAQINVIADEIRKINHKEEIRLKKTRFGKGKGLKKDKEASEE